MSRSRSRALRPSFVVVSALVGVVACDGYSGKAPSHNLISNPPPPDSTSSFNPPPPPPPTFPQPDFGPTVSREPSPPALGGATLIVARDGTSVIATDPDRDRVAIVDLSTEAAKLVELEPGDEPGRLVEDGAKRAHVVLDRAGAVATVDLVTGNVLARRPVCAGPQGIAEKSDRLYVACSGGEIVALPTDPTGSPEVFVRIDRDLRDVVAIGADLLVSRLRSAEVLRVRLAGGAVVSRALPSSDLHSPTGGMLDPFVGWRLAPSGTGSAVLLHQMARAEVVDVERPQAYGALDPCGGSVVSAITSFEPDPSSNALVPIPHQLVGHGVAPLDIARAHDGTHWAVIAAGNAHTRELPQVQLIDTATGPGGCSISVPSVTSPDGQAVAVAFTPTDTLVVLSREPAAIHVRKTDRPNEWRSIPLGGASREDTGHAIFHSNTGGGIACVSCHPGGADDGRVWSFSTGARRTQSLQGTLEGTAPYHWSGDVPGVETFASEVFTGRMGGPELDSARTSALRTWLMRLPAPRVSPPVDPAAAARGKALFEAASVGCSGCHSGAKLTNNESADVGTGGTFQVPSLLGVGLRAPYLHDGRARTLLERFGPIGGGDDHGQTSSLSPVEVQDLVRYLETL
jgi:DNA-binding beta-propeller fold protein YncE/mono/diheme cytochrome c family protein